MQLTKSIYKITRVCHPNTAYSFLSSSRVHCMFMMRSSLQPAPVSALGIFCSLSSSTAILHGTFEDGRRGTRQRKCCSCQNYSRWPPSENGRPSATPQSSTLSPVASAVSKTLQVLVRCCGLWTGPHLTEQRRRSCCQYSARLTTGRHGWTVQTAGTLYSKFQTNPHRLLQHSLAGLIARWMHSSPELWESRMIAPKTLSPANPLTS